MKKDLTNLVSLGGIQLVNAIFPLLVFPWLLGKLGVEEFSRLVLTESLMLLALVVVVYSFDIDGVRKLVGEQSNERQSELFFEIFWVRLILLLLSGSVLLGVISFFNKELLLLQSTWLIYLFAYVFQQAWFFQGKESNAVVSIFNILGRLLGAFCLVILVRQGAALEIVPLCVGLSYLIPAILSFVYGLRKYGLRPRAMKKIDIRRAVVAGRHIFVGNVFVYLFRGSNVLLLKWLSVDSAVAIYAVAEKIIKCLQASMRPINQFAFPKVARALQNSATKRHQNYIVLIGRYLLPQWGGLFALVLLAGVGVFSFSSDVIRAYPTYFQIQPLLVVMVAAVFFGVANFIYGSCGLNVLGLDRDYARIIVLVGGVTFCISGGLIFLTAEIGAAISYVLGEFLLLGMLIYRLSIYEKSLPREH